MVAVLALLIALAEISGIGKQFADFGRRVAGSEGWYGDRRRIQALAIAGLSVASSTVVIAGWFFAGMVAPRLRFLLALFVTLIAYLAVREISLHQVDSVLNTTVSGGLRLGTAIELAVIALMTAQVLRVSVRQLDSQRPGNDRTGLDGDGPTTADQSSEPIRDASTNG